MLSLSLRTRAHTTRPASRSKHNLDSLGSQAGVMFLGSGASAAQLCSAPERYLAIHSFANGSRFCCVLAGYGNPTSGNSRILKGCPW
jgi:hypothetical protein